LDLRHRDREDATSELPISRIAMRRVLVEGLDDVIHYGKKFVAFEDVPHDAVTARFEDRSSTSGDVLIGADGAGSRLRTQLLPHAQRVDTGIVAVSGKVSLSDDIRRATPQPILHGPTLILGPQGCFMFSSAVDYEVAAGGEHHYDREKYVIWGFSAHDDTLHWSENGEQSRGQAETAAVVVVMYTCHPATRRLVQITDASTVPAFPIRPSVPLPPWPTQKVTLLGDALHNMTPFRGIGANT